VLAQNFLAHIGSAIEMAGELMCNPAGCWIARSPGRRVRAINRSEPQPAHGTVDQSLAFSFAAFLYCDDKEKQIEF